LPGPSGPPWAQACNRLGPSAYLGPSFPTNLNVDYSRCRALVVAMEVFFD